jgi:uncharacterized protein YjgD (DUF1641 family)
MHAQAVLATLTNAEILRHAQVDFDPLTGTALEAELLQRFQKHADVIDQLGLDVDDEDDVRQAKAAVELLSEEGSPEPETARALLAALKQHDIEDPAALKVQLQLLEALAEFDIDTPDALRKQLDRIAKFDQVMQDLAEPFATLQTLVTTE